MIRRDREIVDRAAQLAIVDACDVCRVCLNGADGYPYAVPLNFGEEVSGDDGEAVMALPLGGRDEGARGAALRALEG